MPSPATLGAFSNSAMYAAIGLYAVAMLAYGVETAGRVVSTRAAGRTGPSSSTWLRAGVFGTTLAVMAFAFNGAAVLSRGLAEQRAPWGNMYEFVVVGALAAGGAYLTLLSRFPIRAFGVWVIAIILLALGLAITVLYVPIGALVPVLNSYWLVVHVAAAITSGGIFTVCTVAAALYLVRSRADRRATKESRELRGYAASLPTAETLDRVAHGAAIFAFPIWTFAVMAGAIWAENAWGRYWGWDPKETWAFITWILYAAYLHAQSTAGWHGKKASWFAVAGYLAFLFNFIGVNIWITGLHSYAGV